MFVKAKYTKKNADVKQKPAAAPRRRRTRKQSNE